VRINETWKDHTSPEIELLRAAGVGKALDLSPGTDCTDAIIADKECAVANDCEIAERVASARYWALQRYKLGTPGNQQVGHVRIS
jgi:hypothetical protein